MKILSIFGTRPEAIKMAPVIKALEKDVFFQSIVCVTAQHREMLDQVNNLFEVKPDFDLNLMTQNQSLSSLTSRILNELTPIIDKTKPDYIFVQGDTTTAFVGALAGFYQKVKIAHIEAGLRTNNLAQPFPEEANRQLAARLADLHFCPTETAKENLIKENINKEKCFVMGNTVIDALKIISNKLDDDKEFFEKQKKLMPEINSGKKLILVTGHRRENFGEGFFQIFDGIETLSKRDDVEIIYPVHLNPNVKNVAFEKLSNIKNIHLIPPVDYPFFVYLMKNCYLIITDSGGIQEEAPTLGKPVLVTRNVTERPEAVFAGSSKLVGSNKNLLIEEANKLLNSNDEYSKMAAVQNPYGDGKASEKIINIIKGLN